MKDTDKKDEPKVSGGAQPPYIWPGNPYPPVEEPIGFPPEPMTPVDPWITDPPVVNRT